MNTEWTMRLLASAALLGFFLFLASCQEKVTMPTKYYEPPTMQDTAIGGGGGAEADQPSK